MQAYFGIISIALFVGLVLIRVRNLSKHGIEAMEFGGKDKKDFFILPFALFYFYLIIANTFALPTIKGQELFHSQSVSWIGVLVCSVAVVFFLWSMISFRTSFRVGLVENMEQGLITNGAFAISRNPIYLSFAMMLVGQFLIFPSWILLIYIMIGISRFHIQVLKEEKFLTEQYGEKFKQYCKKTGRYF